MRAALDRLGAAWLAFRLALAAELVGDESARIRDELRARAAAVGAQAER